MDKSFLAALFSRGLAYGAYVAGGTDEQRRRWKQVYDAATLTAGQKALLAGFSREMKVLVVSGIWCGDCVQQCPLLAKIAEAAGGSTGLTAGGSTGLTTGGSTGLTTGGKIDLRFVDRDEHAELTEQVRINDGSRVPIAIFMAEDGAWCGTFGDRSVSRYRAMAVRQLGPSCPIGIMPPDIGEMAATLADWVTEFERIQLMLRLSSRLRALHGD
jgi:thiol-disulfide isomerase/thioredoxin